MNRFNPMFKLGVARQYVTAIVMLLLPLLALATQWEKQDVAPLRQDAGISAHYTLRSIKTGAPLHGQTVSKNYRLKWSPTRRPSDADTATPTLRILSPLLDSTVGVNPLPMVVDIDGDIRTHYETLKSGLNTVILQASNECGNSARDTVHVFLDDVPPVISNISPIPGSWVTNSFLHVTYTADAVTYNRDFILAEGLNTVVLDAADSVGNMDHDTVTYRLDTQAPTVVIMNPAQDTSVRIDSVLLRYTVDGQVQSRWVKLVSGSNKVVAQSTDSAGNVGRDTVLVRYIPGCRPDILVIPTQVAQLGQQFRPLDLMGYVTHCAYPLDQMQFLLSNGSNVSAAMVGTKMNFTLGNAGWYGLDSVRLIVQDPDGLRDTAIIALQRKNTLTVNALVRDFKEINTIDPTNNHPDFQPNGTCSGIGDLQTHIKISGADPDDRNPVQLPGNTNCFRTRFSEWYTTSQDTLINRPFQINLTFVDGGNGTVKYTNTNFFPIDKDSVFVPVGKSPNTFGHLQSSIPQHNFGFTMEFHAQFQYKRGTNQVFKFTGDDDVWVFINDSLLLDLGGIHPAMTDSIKLDNLPANFLVDGQQYPLDFFSAERHTSQSNILITTSLGLSNAQSQITLDKKNYPAGTTGAQVTLVDQSNGPQIETRILEIASSNGDTLRPVATESATFPGKFTRNFTISNAPVQLNDTILQVTAPGTISARYIDPDYGDTTSYTSTYGPQNVVAITTPLENQLFNHSPVPVVWNVNGLAQTTQLSASLVQGSNRVVRSYTDETGTSGDTVNVSLDSIAPHIIGIPSAVDGNNGWYRGFATVSFACTDETRLVFCSSPGSVTSNGRNIPVTGLARDSAGNTASSLVSINRDAMLPSLSLASSAQVPLKGSARVTLTLNASDSLSGLQSLICNGSAVPLNAIPRTYQQVMPSGSQTFACSATDSAGNVQVRNFQIEVVPNQIPVARQDAYSVNAGVSLTVSAPGLLLNDSDTEVDTLRALLSRTSSHGISTLNANGSLTYVPSAGFVGLDSLAYRITDGKDTSAAAWVVFNVLHVPLTLIITSPVDGFLTNSTSVVVLYTVNGMVHSRSASLVEGANALVIDTLDDIGQVVADTVLGRKDGIPPLVQFQSPLDGFTTNLNPIPVDWTADGAAQTTGRTEVLVQGLNTITRVAVDSAGNQGQASIQITLDTIAPLVKILAPIGGSSVENSVVKVTWTVDGTLQVMDTTANLVEGDNLIVRSATDAAGNVGSDTVHVTHARCFIVSGDSVHFHETRSYNCIDVQAGGSLYAHRNLSTHTLTVESGGRMYSDDTLRADTVLIQGGGILSHTALSEGEGSKHLNVIASKVNIETGALVDVSAKGFPAGFGPDGQQSSTYFVGGSHSGAGYGSSFIPYGSYLQPETPGSGGGLIGGSAPYVGAGGGVIKIQAQTVILDGAIRADGETAYYGSGAGGSIWLSASNLKGGGNLSANGNTSGYGGSGGRIAAYADSIPAFIMENSKAAGYSGGTLYFKDTLGVHALWVDTGVGGISKVVTPLLDHTLNLWLKKGSRTQFTGDTHVKQVQALGITDAWFPGKIQTATLNQTGGQLEVRDTCQIDSVLLEGTATLTHAASKADSIRKVLLISEYLHIAAGAKIDASGKGFPVGTGSFGQQSTTNFVGGSHSGAGYGSSFSPYGSYSQPETPGGGGGVIGGGAPYYGAGGGLVKIEAHTVILDGAIRADGETAYYGSGAGGSIWLSASNLQGAGNFSANGNTSGYGGSGGRIAAYADSIPAFIMENSKAAGYAGGTLYFKDTLGVHALWVDTGVGGISKILSPLNDPNLEVHLNNGSRTQFTSDTRAKSFVALAVTDAWFPGKINFSKLYLTGGQVEVRDTCQIDSVFLEGTAALTHRASKIDSTYKFFLIGEYLHIAAGAKIDVSGKGFPAGTGPGGQMSSTYNVGGSHAGRGYGTSFSTYGNYLQPVSSGSGGGMSTGISPYAGAGGGVVKIEVQTIALEGKIKADGELGYYGSGAGGSVWLKSPIIVGSGSVSAIGDLGGIAGGGGRIALDNCNLNQGLRDSLKVTGFEPGSVYLSCIDPPIVKIESPINGSSVYRDTIRVVWQAEGRSMNIDTLEYLNEGANSISRCFTANNGLTKCDTVNVRLDRSPPVVKIISPLNNSYTSTYQSTVTWSVDGVLQTTGAIENLYEGPNRIIRSFMDSTGSEGADTVWVTLDTKPPQITLISPAQSGTILGNMALIRWMADSVEQASILHAMDTSEANMITLRAMDSAGNKDSLRVFLYSGTEAPNLMGLFHTQAESLLTIFRLGGDSTWVDNDSLQTGIVFKQKPAAGEIIRLGFPVKYQISNGLNGVDLVPQTLNADSLVVDPLTLAVRGSVKIVTANRGRAVVNDSFDIIIFEDRNLDQKYTPNVDLILGQSMHHLSINPKDSTLIEIPVSGALNFNGNRISAVLDWGNRIQEIHEDNNVTQSMAKCKKLPLTMDYTPHLKWSWRDTAEVYSSVFVKPMVANMNDDNGDGLIAMPFGNPHSVTQWRHFSRAPC